MEHQVDTRLKSGFTPEKRRQLRSELESFSSQAVEKYGHPLEAIVQEIRYWQQSTTAGRTNPRKNEKQESFRFWNQQCMVCGDRIETLTQATFHHLKRGVPNLHSPENMRPLHRDEDKGCHEKLHGVPPGSLTAGSRRGRE